MTQFIGCDAHKKYSVFAAADENGPTMKPRRVEHQRERFWEFLRELPAGSPMAVETSGCWYWIVDEMEAEREGAYMPQTNLSLSRNERMEDAIGPAKGVF